MGSHDWVVVTHFATTFFMTLIFGFGGSWIAFFFHDADLNSRWTLDQWSAVEIQNPQPFQCLNRIMYHGFESFTMARESKESSSMKNRSSNLIRQLQNALPVLRRLIRFSWWIFNMRSRIQANYFELSLYGFVHYFLALSRVQGSFTWFYFSSAFYFEWFNYASTVCRLFVALCDFYIHWSSLRLQEILSCHLAVEVKHRYFNQSGKTQIGRVEVFMDYRAKEKIIFNGHSVSRTQICFTVCLKCINELVQKKYRRKEQLFYVRCAPLNSFK